MQLMVGTIPDTMSQGIIRQQYNRTHSAIVDITRLDPAPTPSRGAGSTRLRPAAERHACWHDDQSRDSRPNSQGTKPTNIAAGCATGPRPKFVPRQPFRALLAASSWTGRMPDTIAPDRSMSRDRLV